jgi:LacI family transcriptional regulator
VIGFDNIPESALADVPLTTIDQSIHEMGAQAVRLLVDLIDGNTERPHDVTLPTALVVRQSTGPAQR